MHQKVRREEKVTSFYLSLRNNYRRDRIAVCQERHAPRLEKSVTTSSIAAAFGERFF